MPDVAQTTEELEIERRIEEGIRERLQARAEAELAARGQDNDPGTNRPAWYPTAIPTDEDMQRRTFPRGTSVSEVIEYDRLQAEARLQAQGLDRPPPPLPEGTVSASASEFAAKAAGR